MIICKLLDPWILKKTHYKKVYNVDESLHLKINNFMICTLETASQISVEATLNLSVLLQGPSPKQSQDYVSKCEHK